MIMTEQIEVTITANVEFEYFHENKESGQSASYGIRSVKHLGQDVPVSPTDIDGIIDTLESLRAMIIEESIRQANDRKALDLEFDGGDVA
jgi:gamma-glutamyl-gamma-aminobutyrate hydrolase PuuD